MFFACASRRAAVPLLLLLAALLVGCGKEVGRAGVSGKVLYKGQPVGNKTLTLSFDGPPTERFSQNLALAADGTFKGEVPKPGPYKVVIAESLAVMEGKAPKPADGAEPPIPEKYRTAATSDLTWTIEAGSNSKTIELKD